ncbi:hypothetical protein CBL_03932 [Carabus blaptoides fortunei]
MSPLHTEAKLQFALDEWIVKNGKIKKLRCMVPLAARHREDEAVTGVILDLILLLEWELSLGFEWSASVIIQLKQYDLKTGKHTESLVDAFSARSVATSSGSNVSGSKYGVCVSGVVGCPEPAFQGLCTCRFGQYYCRSDSSVCASVVYTEVTMARLDYINARPRSVSHLTTDALNNI